MVSLFLINFSFYSTTICTKKIKLSNSNYKHKPDTVFYTIGQRLHEPKEYCVRQYMAQKLNFQMYSSKIQMGENILQEQKLQDHTHLLP